MQAVADPTPQEIEERKAEILQERFRVGVTPHNHGQCQYHDHNQPGIRECKACCETPRE